MIIAMVLIWILFIVLLLLVLVLYRQFGLLYLGSGARVRLTGLAQGRQAPTGQRVVLEGREHIVDWSDAGEGRATLIVFGGPRCPICEKLMPELDVAVDLWGERIDILVVDRLVAGAPTRILPDHRNWRYAVTPDDAFYKSFDVEVSPYAFLIESSGTVLNKRIVNSVEHVAWLVESCVDPTSGEFHVYQDAPVRLVNKRKSDNPAPVPELN